MNKFHIIAAISMLFALGALGCSSDAPKEGVVVKKAPVDLLAPVARTEKTKAPNIIFILTDDQRYDALGFLDPDLDTPNMDRMASDGVHFRNAFVSTALCSPSRASIMTGKYMHHHGIVDNNVGFEKETVFFPQMLQKAGYQTAFIGKWHMGGHDDSPQPGFDHWISFKGQGHYLPKTNGKQNTLNINGKHIEQKGYITDELNGYALDWLSAQSNREPFFMYLSHKAVHADFIPAERHSNQYKDVVMQPPDTMAVGSKSNLDKPLWVRNQRNSWHGVDFPYHSELDILEYRRRYNQSLSAVDDGLGEILDYLEAESLIDNTVVILMGDNGFMFGEHGLIDKRNAYEESMRVPLLAVGAGVAEGQVVEDVVVNIDVAPTLLSLAGVELSVENFDGISFKNQLLGYPVDTNDWRDGFLYEYYWEYNYPSTPTTFAIRTNQYKLIQYHGVWDTEELYDLVNDPHETVNLIDDPDYLDIKVNLRSKLFKKLEREGGVRPSIEFSERFGPGAVFRNRHGTAAAKFPESWIREDGDADVRRHTKNEGGRKGKKDE